MVSEVILCKIARILVVSETALSNTILNFPKHFSIETTLKNWRLPSRKSWFHSLFNPWPEAFVFEGFGLFGAIREIFKNENK